MLNKTLTRADLTEAVYRNVGLSRLESSLLVEMVFEELVNAILKEEPVKISSFATFQIRQKAQRIGRNPKTGEEVPISPRKVLAFRASNILKTRIAQTQSEIKLKAQNKPLDSDK